jgi:hypothetical protein
MLSSPASSDERKPAMLPYSTLRSLALLALLLLAAPAAGRRPGREGGWHQRRVRFSGQLTGVV